MSVRPWSNPDLELFHGTTLGAARNIVNAGVDVRRSRPDCDFGTGFYCTTVERLARERAFDKGAMKSDRPVLVRLSVPRAAVARLSVISFVRGEADAHDFWSLIHFFRNGDARRPGIDLATLFPYDVVFGPIALWRTEQPMKGSDQVSFHTHAAQELLNLGSSRRMITI